SSIRRRPYMSPRRPNSGVATAPHSRLTVSTQLTADTDACRDCSSRGSSGMTALCCRVPVDVASAKANTSRPRLGAERDIAPGRPASDAVRWVAMACLLPAKMDDSGGSSRAARSRPRRLITYLRYLISGRQTMAEGIERLVALAPKLAQLRAA